CYVGQETLAKLATYDGVKQQLRHWRCSDTGSAAVSACASGTSLTTEAGERAGVITSALAGPDGLEGLALVRRGALEEPQLLAGEIPLEISVPAGFVAPPVGAGGLG
ncbi:MAG: aminomethyltransferase, partial [Vulcanococcus sp.]